MLVYILENYVRESRTQCLADMYPASRVSYDLPSRKIEGDSARRVDDMSSLTNALFLLLHIWKEVPLGVYRWTHALKRGQGGGGGTSMFCSLGMCHSAWYKFMGSSILKKVFNRPF